jgi:hypothetical protein
MEQSILDSVKKVLQIGPDDDSFDLDVMIHINSAFSTLHDLGVGPVEGFTIQNGTDTWNDFIPTAVDPVQQNQVKTFVILNTRLLFDPPATSFQLEAFQKQIDQITWRISVRREELDWVDPKYLVIRDPDPIEGVIPGVVDGGDAY